MGAHHASRPHQRLRAALAATACAAVLGTIGVSYAAAAPEPSAAPARQQSTVQALAPAGADVPFVSLEAEDAAHNGTLIGPDYTQGTVASEASGRQAVQLDSNGQRVEFTLTEPANAMTVSLNLPRNRTGTLAVHVNGQKLDRQLQVTSEYSYFDAPWIPGQQTHHLFGHSRMLLGQNLSAGDKVELRVDSGNSAGPYVIDVVDFEQAAAPAGKPSGALDVTDLGADPTGGRDSTEAFRQAVAQGRGGVVWIPPGTFRLDQPLYVENVTIRGAGHWHSEVHSSRFINQGSSPGNVHIRDFAVIGDIKQRVDSDPDNFVNGNLGNNSSVSGMWLQRLKVGLWLTGSNDNLVVEKNRFYDMAADGLNLNGHANGISVRHNFLRNMGDDSLAMWSLHQQNRDSVFEYNTIVQPNLANGIGIYGGADITIQHNLIADTNALGSGIAISNQAFGGPFNPLQGQIRVHGNTLIRTGAMNPNWNHPMSAIRVDAYDSPINADVTISDTTILDSPWSALEFVSGGGTGHAVQNVTVDGALIDGVGTVVVQAETTGSATLRDVVATRVGVAGIYNCPYPTHLSPMTLTDGGGNSGWSSQWTDCDSWPEPGDDPTDPSDPSDPSDPTDPADPADPADPTDPTDPSDPSDPTDPVPSGNLALGRPVTATSHTDVYPAPNAVDGNADSYWESANHAFPQSLTVPLAQTYPLDRIVLKLPPSPAWQTRTQTIRVESAGGGGFSTLIGATGYTFDPATGNTVTIDLPAGTSAGQLRLTFTGNTGWPAGQIGELEVYAP
jgi:hypothetical protein